MNIFRTSYATFIFHYSRAIKSNEQCKLALTPVVETVKEGEFYITRDGLSGFCVCNGELRYLFSEAKGRGASLVDAAKWMGASKLDCFDGFLTKFYEDNGFKVISREPNWTRGEPDVVFMELSA